MVQHSAIVFTIIYVNTDLWEEEELEKRKKEQIQIYKESKNIPLNMSLSFGELFINNYKVFYSTISEFHIIIC